MKRLFLSWSDNACCLVAKKLLERGLTDPDQVHAVVVPTREAARMLREQLAIQSPTQAFLSPRILPLSQLMRPAPNSISAGAELMQWHHLLMEHGGEKKQLYPHGKEFKSENWLREAKQKIDLLQQMAKEGLDHTSPRWQELAESDPRWAELGELQAQFRHKIHAQGLVDRTEPYSAELAPDSTIILACVPQLPQSVRQMLSQNEPTLEIWIHAPAEQADHFDDWGCPKESWLQPCSAQDLGLDRHQWREHYLQAADLAKMAELAGQRAAAINAAAPVPHQIAFAVCDAAMEPCIEEELCHHGATVYRPRGLSFASSSWNKVLRELMSIIDALELSGLPAQSDIAHYPAPVLIRLLKWPSMHRILGRECSASTLHRIAFEIDDVQFKSIPVYLSSLQRHLKRSKSQIVEPLLQLAEELHRALSSPQQLLQCLENWVLQSGSTDPQQAKIDAFFLDQIQQIQDYAQEASKCRDILLTLQLLCASHATPAIRASQSLDLLGWMEMSFCPARHLVIAGMHNGIIPERNSTDALQTSGAMKILGLPSDEQKAARDAYLLRSIIAGRGIENTFFTFSLYDGKQNPLSPSSLLLRLCPQEKLPEFAAHFFDQLDKLPRTPVIKSDGSGWHYKAIALRDPKQRAQLATLSCEQLGIANPMAGKQFSPSLLKQFLQCPLRFWMSRIYELDSSNVEEEKQNLNAQELGTFLHAVLEQFIRLYPSAKAFEDAGMKGKEEEELLRLFEEKYQPQYGKKGLLPQELQREGMRMRLQAYLPLHLELWEEGWECATDREGKLMLEYPVRWNIGPHCLSMVIDRVDQRRRKDGIYEYRVFDYKTGMIDGCNREHLVFVKEPDLMKAYLGEKLKPVYTPLSYTKASPCRWANLQLPLYAAWLYDYFHPTRLDAGYIHLSRKCEEVDLMLWKTDNDTQGLMDLLDSEENEEDIHTLLDSALSWAKDCMDLISQGQCFIPAEHLNWAIKKDYLFGELSQLQSLEKLFITNPSA